MASIALRAENSCFLSHYCASTQSSIFFNKSVASLTKSNSHFRYSRNRLKLGVSCSIKERESERVSELLGNGLLVERLEQAGPSLGSDYEKDSGLEEVGLEGNWPPWERIPERYKLIGTTSLAFVICNMDKVNLSVAIIPMSHQFGWNSSVAGLVQSSFFWGYALSQLPGGWLAKIFGGRKVLEIGVLIWSLATALVPVLAGFMPGLILARIMVGTISSHLIIFCL
ncbi:probable anion transporter 6, chloroplastic [Carica papaya]|uniref:probable anion transporter 6, chloroplastic n=1 Tax=Carica papaya TaxID=3649 RepID=UPI000B8CAAF8|nr:probable anion transporter 6, chloroplastic [Carica papaya]